MSIYPGSYKFVVEFEKIMAKGVLNGLTIKDRVHFVNEKDARRWIKDIRKFDKDSRYTEFKIKAVA